ncbi:MAG: 2Fe-2S iron-sulfur cluster binding domain-containing protein [Planctomycetes bacterium]|nr:2Fe-2S iron-sulfur cluster binding domain-containing protein [Planctomycetota bacterium]
MVTVFISVLVISSIGGVLALLLVLSEKFIANYGICTVDINAEKQIEVQGGQSLLSCLVEEDIFIPSACGGRGTCGYCKLKVIEGGGLLLPTETPFLSDQEQKDDIRLSCQVKVRNDIFIEIEKELLSVRQYECICSGIEDLTHDIKLFKFGLAGSEEIDFIAGQYVQLLTPVYFKGGEEVYRAYSVASDPLNKGAIELIIRLVPNGICTTYCFEHLSIGDTILMNGPYGEFHLSDTESPMVFIAGGSGMAPIRCILSHMLNTGSKRKAVYYFGANKVSELFMIDEIKQFENDLDDFRFVPVVALPDPAEHWTGLTGLVTEAVESDLENAADYEAYLCGSPGMIEASGKVLAKLGVPEGKIYFDSFA